MSNFNAIGNASLQASDGGVVTDAFNTGVNAKVLLDDVFGAGVLDLAPYLASITVGKAFIVKAAASDFTISEDGVNFSTRKRTTHYVNGLDSGAIPLKITLTSGSRVQVLAAGDP